MEGAVLPDYQTSRLLRHRRDRKIYISAILAIVKFLYLWKPLLRSLRYKILNVPESNAHQSLVSHNFSHFYRIQAYSTFPCDVFLPCFLTRRFLEFRVAAIIWKPEVLTIARWQRSQQSSIATIDAIIWKPGFS